MGKKEGRTTSPRKRRKTEESVPPCDAVVSHEVFEVGGKKYMSLILAHGWEKILDRVGIDDPFIMVDWNVENLAATVATLQGHATAAALANPPPAWLAAPYSTDSVRIQILQHLVDSAKQNFPDAANGRNDHVGGVVGRLMVGPNSTDGYASLKCHASGLPLDSFFSNHATLPLGDFYMGADCKAKNVGVRSPVDSLTGSIVVFN